MSEISGGAPAPAPSSPSSAPSPSAPAAKSAPVAPAASLPPANSKLVPSDAKSPAPSAVEQAEKKAEAERRKYKGKVDGGEREWELTDDEIVTRLQKSEGAEKRMQEAAEQRKKVESVFKYIKENPWEALKDPVFGLDMEQLAEKRLAEKYRIQLMTPEQRAVHEAEAKAKQYETQLQSIQRKEQETAQREMDQRVFQQTEQEMLSALQEEGMEHSFETISLMAELGKFNIQNKLGLTPKQIAAEVKGKLEDARGSLESKIRKGLDGEKLLSHLGDETVRKVTAAVIARVKGGKAAPSAQAPATTQADDGDDYKKERTSSSYQQFRKFLRT